MVRCQICGYQAQNRMTPSCPWCGSYALVAVQDPAAAAIPPTRQQAAQHPTGRAAPLAEARARRTSN
jgi:hypothetical protein